MNIEEKERLIKKDIASIENRVRSAFNQGYEMGVKELKAYRENTCGDAISRKHLLEEIAMLKKSPWFNENTYGSKIIRKEAVEIVEDVCIKREPSVTPQQRTGRWIAQDIHNCHTSFKCSECDYTHNFMHLYGKPTADYTYCPMCGSKMEVES